MKKSNHHLLSCCILSFLLGIGINATVDVNDLNIDMVNDAANLVGLQFTPAEVDSMINDLEINRTSYQELRKNPIPNHIPLSLAFNPLPKGFELNKLKAPVRYGYIGTIELPEKKEDLAFYSVRELAELIRTKKISSVELTKFFIDRLKKYNPQLKCVITFTEDLALKQAQAADRDLALGRYKGILHGIPYGAKDLLAVKGYKTTWGATPFKNQVINENAAVIDHLEESGAVLVAKLSMGALAWGDVWYGGQTRNPWDTEQGSSGSSAGSASAVSAGLVPFAIGTETLGSIVSPSTVCGVTSLRPTFGRVSRAGAMALSWSMDKIGPMCRTVEDCAAVFNAIHGPDGRDNTVIDAAFNYNTDFDVSKIRVGYVRSDFKKDYGFHKQDSLAIAKLEELGFNLVPVELPEMPPINYILSVEAAAAFDDLTLSGKDDQLVRQIKNSWPNVFRSSRLIPAVEYIQANRLRSQLIEEMHEALRYVDVYLSPSWASSNLRITNLTGHPAVVLPNGFSEDDTPTSITFTGQLFDEEKLLSLAKYYQDNTDFHKRHPNSIINN